MLLCVGCNVWLHVVAAAVSLASFSCSSFCLFLVRLNCDGNKHGGHALVTAHYDLLLRTSEVICDV